jgi:probable F420-dependent oxidoreductase
MSVHIGRTGLWAPLLLWLQEPERLADTAREVEELGFGTIWVANGPTVLEVAADILDATRTVTVATGIANIWVHPAGPTADAYARLAARHPDRFLLGLGNGPREPAQWRMSPYAALVRYLDELDARGVPCEGRMLAAVGPRMLRLAAGRSRGAHPFMTTPEHTHLARAALGDGPLLAPELKVVLASDPAEARGIARQALGFYLSKRGYSGNLRRLGYTDDDLAGGGSDRLIDALVGWGDVDRVLRRVEEHRQAGADHVTLQPLTWESDHPDTGRRRLPMEQYRRLAEALTGS